MLDKKKILHKIEYCIMYISLQERKKRELEHYKKELSRLENMDSCEFDLEYIKKKSLYEHKKNILSLIVISLLISVFINIWKYFFSFVEKIIQFSTLYEDNSEEAAAVVFVSTLIIILFITIFIFWMLLEHIKGMHHLYRQLLILEDMREKRKY